MNGVNFLRFKPAENFCASNLLRTRFKNPPIPTTQSNNTFNTRSKHVLYTPRIPPIWMCFSICTIIFERAFKRAFKASLDKRMHGKLNFFQEVDSLLLEVAKYLNFRNYRVFSLPTKTSGISRVTASLRQPFVSMTHGNFRQHGRNLQIEWETKYHVEAVLARPRPSCFSAI